MPIDPETKRSLDDLAQGKITAAGEFTLALSPATSTVIVRRGVSATSVILTQALSANASNADITRIVPGKNTFTVHHAASANTRTHRYVFFTDAS
jgi:hypothetical protein